MGLRLREGVDLEALAKRCDVDPETLISRRRANLLESYDLVLLKEHRLFVLPKGMLLLDRILAELVET